MKKIVSSLFLTSFLYASTVTSHDFIYTFDDDGTPKYRIILLTGAVEVISKYGWIDLRFKEHIKDLNLFKDKEFKQQLTARKQTVLTNYFNKEIKPLLEGLKKEKTDKLLQIFIIHNTK